MPLDTRWEGSRAFLPVARMVREINRQPASVARPEEQMVGRALSGMLGQAHVVSCPPEQLNAVADDIFDDLGAAFAYASHARMPFEVTFFDFLDELGEGPPITMHFIDGGGTEMNFDLKAVIAADSPDEQQTTYLPIIGMKGHAPEEIGAAFVHWKDGAQDYPKPARWTESVPGVDRPVTLYSVSTAMEASGETPRAVAGALVGIARSTMSDADAASFQTLAATQTATVVRQALKLIYLLDSVNIELAPAPVSRQVRRNAERQGAKIAWTVRIKPPTRAPRTEEPSGSREYSHRFEVRGNFAHHAEGTWLFEHSAPKEIRPCPRCGRCRRIWRPAHIKGPRDRPLAIKFRRVAFTDEPGTQPTPARTPEAP